MISPFLSSQTVELPAPKGLVPSSVPPHSVLEYVVRLQVKLLGVVTVRKLSESSSKGTQSSTVCVAVKLARGVVRQLASKKSVIVGRPSAEGL